jgi:hypothetical protein
MDGISKLCDGVPLKPAFGLSRNFQTKWESLCDYVIARAYAPCYLGPNSAPWTMARPVLP